MNSRLERFKNVLSSDEVLQVVRKKFGNNASVVSFDIKPLSDTPMGFLGEHLRLLVNVEGKGVDVFFIKILPSGVQLHMQYVAETRCFYKEVEIYTTLLEDLKNARKKTDTKWRPDFYYSKDEVLIVVEDLSTSGYKTCEEEFLDENHLRATLESLASMHASSIIFEEKLNCGEVQTLSQFYQKGKVEVGDVYPNLVFETEAEGDTNHIGHNFTEIGFKSHAVILEYLEGYTEEEMNVIKKKWTSELRQLYKLVQPSDKYKNVMNHSDLWSNNILFKYDEQGCVEHAMIIDFQLARYLPPAADVSLLLHLTQCKSFREEKQEHLLKFYYEKFASELKQYNLDCDKWYTWNTFRESYEVYEKCSAILSIHNLPLILLPPRFADMFTSMECFEEYWFNDRSELVREAYLADELYRRRCTEAFHVFIQNYLLDK